MKDKVRDIAFAFALGMILGGLWALFGLPIASLVFGLLVLALLIAGVFLGPERKR